MKVPEPVRAVFDQFPIKTLPAYESEYGSRSCSSQAQTRRSARPPVLAVYNKDYDGLPLDPKCLAAVGVLHLIGQRPEIQTTSPYVSSVETLPILRSGKSTACSLDEFLTLYEEGEKLASSPQFKLFRTLVDTWLDDAWHATIMDRENTKGREAVYGSSAGEFPWPFSRIATNQLEDHLDARNFRAKQATGDDYICSANNMSRVALALTALEKVISAPLSSDGTPTLIDILVASYTWPIITVVPDSALAALVTPGLRQHAQEIRNFLISSLTRDSTEAEKQPDVEASAELALN